MYSAIKKECLEAILNTDRDKANLIIDEWIETNGEEDVLTSILDPVLIELGDLWTIQKDVSFAQVYVSATIAEDIILKVLSKKDHSHDIKRDHIVILGNCEDNFHSLGRRLIATFLLASGWKVIDLGNDITAEEFVDTAIKENAKIIMVSAMMYTTAKNIIKVREEIDRRGYNAKIALAVGGAIFNLRKNLWKEVGADGTARNAIEAGTLAKELLDKLMG